MRVAVAFLAGKAFTTLGKIYKGEPHLFGARQLTANEVRSMVENLVVLGMKVPEFFKKSLAIS